MICLYLCILNPHTPDADLPVGTVITLQPQSPERSLGTLPDRNMGSTQGTVVALAIPGHSTEYTVVLRPGVPSGVDPRVIHHEAHTQGLQGLLRSTLEQGSMHIQG